jgi:hypothetical protein
MEMKIFFANQLHAFFNEDFTSSPANAPEIATGCSFWAIFQKSSIREAGVFTGGNGVFWQALNTTISQLYKEMFWTVQPGGTTMNAPML